MKQIEKGTYGYISSRKKRVTIKTCLEFGIVLAVLFLGISQTGSRLNALTVVAVVGCLPASKALVECIMLFPHRSLKKEQAEEIAEKTEHLTVIYDMIITSEKQAMPIDCIVISDNTLCGYTGGKKADVVQSNAYLRKILTQKKLDKVSVKLFDNYTAFLTRAEGLNNIAAIEQMDVKAKEERIKKIILTYSL